MASKRLIEYLKTVEVAETAPAPENPAESTVDAPKGSWTSSQRNATWKYADMKAKQLNDAGLDMRLVLKPQYNIPWTKDSFHDHIWIPVQKAMYGTDSMRDLKKTQISPIAEVIERELSEKHGLEYLPFPSDDQKAWEELGHQHIETSVEYPTDYQDPKF